jgi:hypothetical protein
VKYVRFKTGYFHSVKDGTAKTHCGLDASKGTPIEFEPRRERICWPCYYATHREKVQADWAYYDQLREANGGKLPYPLPNRGEM